MASLSHLWRAYLGLPAASGGQEKLGAISLAGPAGDVAGFKDKLAAAWGRAEAVLLLDPAMPTPGRLPNRAEVAQMQAACQLSPEDSMLLIPTSGSSGGQKWVVHTLQTLAAAADCFVETFSEAEAHHVTTLPLAHVGGLMPLFRAWRGQGRLTAVTYRDLTPELVTGATLSLVPVQVKRLLEDEPMRVALAEAKRILVGGAALTDELATGARQARWPLAPCYGMTETAAMVTCLPPERFLAGESGVGQAFPGMTLTWGEGQRLGLTAPGLGYGYWRPENGWQPFERTPFWTDDAAEIDPLGSLTIKGRLDRLIISGGRKIDPAEVESALQALPEVAEAVVLGVPDPEWGEVVGAAVVLYEKSAMADLDRRLRPTLPAYAMPKAWAILDALPRTSLGKPDRGALAALLGD